MMFKAILLGQWHNLSDPELMHSLRIRLDFIAFCGMPFDELPDDTTLCRFRNRLIKQHRLQGLLDEINRQLQANNLMVKKTQGALLDATIVASAARPKSEFVVEVQNNEPVVFEDGSQPGMVVEEKLSADPEATWLKKGKKSTLGYRCYAVTDEEDGYLLGAHTAPANESEQKHFENALSAAKINAERAERVLTDKGYASKANRDFLRKSKIKSGICHKAVRAHPLSARQHRFNKKVAQRRWKVEQFFGTIKRKFDMSRARYFGALKVNGQMLLKGICANLVKAVNKMEWTPQGILAPKILRMA